ncbi:MAG TPA: LLM class F420-dependent oxidoreductase [Candidatus Binatia bacterium]|jgi:F420-dependent oxidoreductase-like protein|nr:LLM class F420-dependent oxidoreductase [Candidatus Binatia bacterium]
MGHPVRFGVQTGQQGVEWATMLEVWRKADEWGYDSLWNFDHFYPIFVAPEGPCLEGWTTLAALAQATKRARVGTLVNGNTYRHPAVTAKMAASLDHISGGRFNLGIGAGWFEREHRDFGIDFKDVPRRLQALDEACRIIRGMFTQETTTVHGKHYTVTDALGLPKPLQTPHPPILIGGTGEKVLLKLVARHADMWNASAGAERMAHLIEIIRRHADAEKRDADAIEKTVMMPLCYRATPDREAFVCNLIASMRQTTPEEARQGIMIGDRQECLDTVARFTKVGVTHFIFMTFAPYFENEIQAFAEEVMPAARR